MSGHDSKYFSTTKKGEIPELKEELNSQYKVHPRCLLFIYIMLCNYALINYQMLNVSGICIAKILTALYD